MVHFTHVVGSKTDVFDVLRTRLAGRALPAQFQRVLKRLAEQHSKPPQMSATP